MMKLSGITLILGGARSGKSRYGEALAERSGFNPVYVATATAGDEEMADRIRVHRQRRGGNWKTCEEPLDLTGVLGQERNARSAVLVDCLTLWLSNLMAAEMDEDRALDELLVLLEDGSGPVSFISNEVGQGIVPDNELARRFRDAQGRLNQKLAMRAENVILMTAGLPLVLKGALPNE